MESDKIGHSKKLSAKQEAYLKALEMRLGIVSAASEDTGTSRSTHYEWLKNEEYAARVEELKSVTLDFGESCLHRVMRAGSAPAIIFFLKTKGRERGYIERSEFKIEHSYSELSDEELDAKIAEMSSNQVEDEE